MPKEVDPKDTTRAAAYALWTKAPNPMVTFFKTFDVTNLISLLLLSGTAARELEAFQPEIRRGRRLRQRRAVRRAL